MSEAEAEAWKNRMAELSERRHRVKAELRAIESAICEIMLFVLGFGGRPRG